MANRSPPAEGSGLGLMIGIELVRSQQTREKAPALFFLNLGAQSREGFVCGFAVEPAVRDRIGSNRIIITNN